jgi:hypothetical protein
MELFVDEFLILNIGFDKHLDSRGEAHWIETKLVFTLFTS